MTIDFAPLFAAPPQFQTPRLTVRFVQHGDLDDLMQVNGNDEVTRYLPYAAWKQIDDANAWYERAMKRHEEKTVAQFVIERKATENARAQVIGSALLLNLYAQNETAEIGYVLGREHWRQGFTSEALRPLIDYAFNSLQLHRLDATIDPRNTASANVLGKFGFVQEGLRRENWMSHEGRADSAIFGLLRRDRKAA